MTSSRDDGDRDSLWGVRAHGLGGQDGDHVPANDRWGELPFAVHAAAQAYKLTVEFVYFGGAISANRDPTCRDNAPNPHGMGALWAILDGNLWPPGCALAAEVAAVES